jgi:hypothetical protein
MKRIAIGYGTGLAATLKTIAYVEGRKRALSRAISALRNAVGPTRPSPPRRPDPALDNWITK